MRLKDARRKRAYDGGPWTGAMAGAIFRVRSVFSNYLILIELCSCQQLGHWSGDANCPLRRGRDGAADNDGPGPAGAGVGGQQEG